MASQNESRVQFNLHNVHIAVLNDAATMTYETPLALPGAVSLQLDPQGSENVFYADGIAYYQSYGNTGYSGSVEVARFTDEIMDAIWGVAKDANQVMVENAFTEGKAFALLFQVDGDSTNSCYAFYNCKASRPSVAAETNTDTKTPKTQNCSLTAAPLSDGTVSARTSAAVQDTVRQNWFKSVYKPAKST